MPINPDPYRNYKFRVEMDGFVRAGFSKISGLAVNVEDIEYREGDEPEFTTHYPGQTSYDDLTFERGMSNDSDFLTKLNLIFDPRNGFSQGDDNYRFNGTIYLRNKAGVDVYQWEIDGAWAKTQEWDDLDASGNDIELSRLIIRPQFFIPTNLAS